MPAAHVVHVIEIYVHNTISRWIASGTQPNTAVEAINFALYLLHYNIYMLVRMWQETYVCK